MSKYQDLYKFSNKQLLKRCLSYFLPYKTKVVVAFISMGIVSLTAGATAYLIKPAMDDIFIKKDVEALQLIPLAFIGVMLVKGVFRFLQTYLMNSTGLRVVVALRNEIFAKVAYLPMHFFEESQVGVLMSRILGDAGGIKQSLPSIIMLIREILTIIVLIGVVFWQDAYLAFWSIIVLPFAIYPLFHFGKVLRKLGRKGRSLNAEMNAIVQENLSGIKVVKAFGNEKEEIKGFEKESFGLMRLSLKQIFANELSSRVMEIIGAFGVGAVLWYGGNQVISGHSTPGTFFSFMAALIMLYEPIKKISSANMSIQTALASAERVFDLLDSPKIRRETGGVKKADEPFKELALENVTFTYPRLVKPVINGMTMQVKVGERVAIVGPSGAGKTTLVNLIPRFYDPQGGKILLNGTPLHDYTLKSLRLNIGMVSQDTFLFNASITENIAYAQKEFRQEDVINAAKAAYAHDFISDLPDGYDTIVGERGAKLSGGQKQRITIARALLKNPPLLILDEATSALDTESERIVQLALENLMQDRTSIVIAHRLSTILSAHLIVVMEKGKVVAQGKHEKLLETCPLYKRLYNMQFKDFKGMGE